MTGSSASLCSSSVSQTFSAAMPPHGWWRISHCSSTCTALHAGGCQGRASTSGVNARGRRESDSQRPASRAFFAAVRRRSRTGPAGGGAEQNGWLPHRRPAALPTGTGPPAAAVYAGLPAAEGVKRAVAGRDQHPGRVMRRQRRERAGVVSRPLAAGFVMRIAGGGRVPSAAAPARGRSARSAWPGGKR